jgi:hypothetical protein
VWITRIDHLPVPWLVQYGQGQYPLVIIPSLDGKVMQSYPDGRVESVAGLTAYVNELHSNGFKVCGSQWGHADDPEGEADAALGVVAAVPFDGWVMNGEKPYEGGGKSKLYIERFRLSRPHFPLGWTPEQRISIDHNVLQLKGVFYMPQCYPLESGGDLDYVIDWAVNFGYKLENVGPLVQAYTTNNVRPSAMNFRDTAVRRGVGQLTLYTGNQCLDAPEYWRNLVIP